MRNVDRAELQDISTVNGFLSDNPILGSLLERQRNLAVGLEKTNSACMLGSLKKQRYIYRIVIMHQDTVNSIQ